MGVARFNGSADFPGATRFVDGWMGRGFNFPYSTQDQLPDFQALDVLGRGVVQTGRLVLPTPILLRAQISIIRQRAETLTTGELDAGDGRTWQGMTMLRLRLEAPVDRGRMSSVAYSIDYAVLP